MGGGSVQPDNIDTILTALGILFAMFLVISAAVEMILETFRGVLERIGVTYLSSAVSLDDALKISSEFVPQGSGAAAKVSALAAAATATNKVAKEQIQSLNELRDELVKAAPVLTGTVLDSVNKTVAEVRKQLGEAEKERIFWLRLISAVVGLYLAWLTDFGALGVVLEAVGKEVPPPGSLLAQLSWIVTGLAAAGGSSYWHDQLDKVRSLKGAYGQVSKLSAGS